MDTASPTLAMSEHDETVATADFIRAVDEQLGGSGGAVAVCLTDLDAFARLNEEHGRDAGDAALATWTRTVVGSLPPGALVRRLGGDEFAIALPGASAEQSVIILDEIRDHLATHPIEGFGVTITATFGVAARPPHAASTDDLVRCANVALMRGKREGGDRVAIYIEEKMTLKSNYYQRADLDRLARLSANTSRTEASLLREALDDLFAKYHDIR
jgi:diguanylate cyclase